MEETWKSKNGKWEIRIVEDTQYFVDLMFVGNFEYHYRIYFAGVDRGNTNKWGLPLEPDEYLDEILIFPFEKEEKEIPNYVKRKALEMSRRGIEYNVRRNTK